MDAGVANLMGAREEGGFSTKDVSVVMKVSSLKSGRETRSIDWPCASFCCARLKESDMGACYDVSVHLILEKKTGSPTSGKSTQKAFIFIPYKKLAKLSLNLLKLSCINCRCMKLASRSAIESENSATAGSRDSRGNGEEPVLGVKV